MLYSGIPDQQQIPVNVLAFIATLWKTQIQVDFSRLSNYWRSITDASVPLLAYTVDKQFLLSGALPHPWMHGSG